MYSNCLIEAIKAKIITPKNNKICRRGSWLCIFKKEWPHFYWHNIPSDKYYTFYQKDTLSWLQQLWYKGEIIEYDFKRE